MHQTTLTRSPAAGSVPLVTALLLLFSLCTCQRFEPEGFLNVNTGSVSGITVSSAQCGGEVTDDGGAAVTARGVCWSTSHRPVASGSKTTDGTGTGSFTSMITGLSGGTTYYVRAYATSSEGTTYGEEQTFATAMPDFPTVTTIAVSEVNENSAHCGGVVTDDGGAEITARGVCWSTSPGPTVSGSHTTDGSGSGSFTSAISDLTCNTSYYVRAYATNSVGTAYGSQESFSTSECPAGMPTVTTAAISNITETSAQGGGNVTDDGGNAVTARGVCWSTSPGPEITDSKTEDGTGTGSFTSVITGLSPGTSYHVRAYATNSVGTAYGGELDFTTSSLDLPTVTTTVVTDVTETSAQSGGNVTSAGGAPVTARGVCWSTSHDPEVTDSKTEDGTGTGIFTSTITGLEMGTTYYVRAYATNSQGTAYGGELDFTTPSVDPPTVITTAVTYITETTAQSGGNVTSDGGAAVFGRGVCWSTSPGPTISNSRTSDGTGTGIFTSSVTELSPGTTYYLRAFATNSQGTAYGDEKVFATTSGSGTTLTDIDGNHYQTVQIGTQTWMAANLKVTHFPGGSPIPLVENQSVWGAMSATDKAYCWLENDISNKDTLGGLYTWAAAMDGAASSNQVPSGVQGICPDGWHLPSDAEWKVLEMYLGMTQAEADKTGFRGTDEGGQLKEVGLDHWYSPNAGATNSTGFSGCASGYRNDYGTFGNIGRHADYWVSTASDSESAIRRGLATDNAQIFRDPLSKAAGVSIRCVKD